MTEAAGRAFDRHWKVYGRKHPAAAKLRAAEVFFRPILEQLRSQRLRVLDVGCGDGVHWRFLRSLGNRALSYTGVDISAVAIERLKGLSSDIGDDFILTDACSMEVPDRAYDIVFAFGSIGYTREPARCFAEMCRVCSPGGWIGVWVYPRQRGIQGLAFAATRRLCRRLGPFLADRLADLIVPFLPVLPTMSGISPLNASWRQCRELVLVNIAPDTLHFFEEDEIERWFRNHAIKIVHKDPDHPVTIWGRRV